MANGISTSLLAQGGKYLTFQLGGEVYGLEIMKVQEIIGMMCVTHVPRTPEYIRGVINLRGKVIPVVDLRKQFQLSDKEDTDHTCIIVVQVAGQDAPLTMGIIVDEVSEVAHITTDQIEPTPSFGASVDTDYIMGMGKLGQKVLTLLDIDRVLTSKELLTTEQSADQI